METKARANGLIDELERRMPDFDLPVTIDINGCPNSCAHPDHGHRPEGHDDARRDRRGRGIPGASGRADGDGRGLRAEVPRIAQAADDLADYIERVLRTYQEERNGAESFADFVARADAAVLT